MTSCNLSKIGNVTNSEACLLTRSCECKVATSLLTFVDPKNYHFSRITLTSSQESRIAETLRRSFPGGTKTHTLSHRHLLHLGTRFLKEFYWLYRG